MRSDERQHQHGRGDVVQPRPRAGHETTDPVGSEAPVAQEAQCAARPVRVPGTARRKCSGHQTDLLLNLSVKTVETHRAQIMERLGIRDVAGLVRYALRTGLVPPEG